MDDIDNDKIGKLLADLASADRALARAQVVRDQRRRAAGFKKRRSRDQRLIQAGGLFVMAKLMEADLDVVLGALIQAKSVEGKHQAWTGSGEQAFARWRRTGKNPTRSDPEITGTTESVVTEQKRFTRELITRGALVEKAGLLDWPAATILGALLVVARHLGDAIRVASWKRKGAECRAASQPPTFPRIVVAFDSRIPRPIAAALRNLGLKRKRKTKQFEGCADPIAASLIAKDAGGMVHVREPGEAQS